jgi:type II secretion system protein I
MRHIKSNAGFTFIEVLVAMLIFVMAVVVSLSVTDGSVRATNDTKEISTATWLLQNVMVELETKLETEGFDKGCEKKHAAKFEAPYQNYSWLTTCDEIDYQLSQTAAQLAQQKPDQGSDDANQENLIAKFILQNASDYISKAIRELHAEVTWTHGKLVRKIDLTTHIARYDQPLTMPGSTPPTTPGGVPPGGTAPGTPPSQ